MSSGARYWRFVMKRSAFCVSVLSLEKMKLTSVTIHRLQMHSAKNDDFYVGVQVFDEDHDLIRSAYVPYMYGKLVKDTLTVTVSISAVLQPSHPYRVVFFIGSRSSGDLVLDCDRDAVPLGGYHYTGDKGLRWMEQAYAFTADTAPTHENSFFPRVDLELHPFDEGEKGDDTTFHPHDFEEEHNPLQPETSDA
jgi:hypothetical protein